MGERSPAVRRPLSPIGLAVLKALPAGELLDRMIAVYRPRPELIGAAPGDAVLATLRKERNLYAACLEAATGDPAAILTRAESSKERVQRALAHNPHLTRTQRNNLARAAATRRSGALAMAVLEGSRQITVTLADNQNLLDLVSVKSGQHAPEAIARNLRHATAAELDVLLRRFDKAMTQEDAPFRTLLEDAAWTVLKSVSDCRIRIDVETLCALCRIHRGGLGHLTLPRPVYTQLEKLPGRVVLPLARVFNVDQYYRDEELDPLRNAWDHTRTRALVSELGEDEGIRDKRNLSRWSEPAIHDTATVLITKLRELEQLETFEALLPDWSGTLGELIDTAVTL